MLSCVELTFLQELVLLLMQYVSCHCKIGWTDLSENQHDPMYVIGFDRYSWGFFYFSECF